MYVYIYIYIYIYICLKHYEINDKQENILSNQVKTLNIHQFSNKW